MKVRVYGSFYWWPYRTVGYNNPPVLEQSNKIRKKKNWDGGPKGLNFWTPKYKAIKLPFFCRWVIGSFWISASSRRRCKVPGTCSEPSSDSPTPVILIIESHPYPCQFQPGISVFSHSGVVLDIDKTFFFFDRDPESIPYHHPTWKTLSYTNHATLFLCNPSTNL